MRREPLAIMLLLFATGMIVFPIPLVNAAGPNVNNSGANQCDIGGGGATTCAASMTVTTAGDIIVVGVELSTPAGVVPASVTVTGGGVVDFVKQVSDDSTYFGTFHYVTNIWSGTAVTTGTVTYTVSW